MEGVPGRSWGKATAILEPSGDIDAGDSNNRFPNKVISSTSPLSTSIKFMDDPPEISNFLPSGDHEMYFKACCR